MQVRVDLSCEYQDIDADGPDPDGSEPASAPVVPSGYGNRNYLRVEKSRAGCSRTEPAARPLL